jgi:hypothetical protein
LEYISTLFLIRPNALYELHVLDDFILNKLNPGSSVTDLNQEKMEQYVALVRIEARECHRRIFCNAHSLLDKEQACNFIRNHQAQLCFLIDQLFHYRELNPEKIFHEYTNCLQIIERILTEIVKSVQDQFTNHFNFNANVTVISQLDYISNFKERLDEIQKSNLNLDAELLSIALQPIFDFIKAAKNTGITYQRINYFDILLKKIESLEIAEEDTEKLLISALISINFNSFEFYYYFTDNVQNELDEIESENTKHQILSKYLKEINQIYAVSELALRPNLLSIKEQLISWLGEEIEFLEKESRMLALLQQSKTQGEPEFKIHTELSVAQLGYFLKLLVDTGIIKNSNQKDVIRFFSRNIRSKQTGMISQTSLNSKYYNHEESNVIVVKDFLIKMLNEINKKI